MPYLARPPGVWPDGEAAAGLFAQRFRRFGVIAPYCERQD